jgi:hypothetical protein
MRLFDAFRGLFGGKRETRRQARSPRGESLTSSEIAELSGVAETVSRILGPDGGLVISSILIATSGLDRTRLVTAWATSPRTGLRMALAQSFAHAFDAVGRRTAQRQLAQDPHANVRMAVQHAALLRHTPESGATPANPGGPASRSVRRSSGSVQTRWRGPDPETGVTGT